MGWIDLVVANDTVQNFLFTNQHNGTLRRSGAHGRASPLMLTGWRAAQWGSIRPGFATDDALGIAIGNFANEPNALYVSQNDSLVFADERLRKGWTGQPLVPLNSACSF